MKNRKAKGALLGLAMVASMASVGYAAWVITNDANAKVENQQITVEEVADKGLAIASPKFTTSALDSKSIHFGSTVDYVKQPGDWLTNNGDPSILSGALTFTVNNAGTGTGDAQNLKTLVITTSIVDKTGYEAYIKLPEKLTLTMLYGAENWTVTAGEENIPTGSKIPSASFVTEGANLNVTIPLKFDWGTTITQKQGDFGCPEAYFNKKGSTSSIKEEAKTFFKTMEKNYNNANYLITVEAKNA